MKLAETVDALGNVTTATFDAAGNQLSSRDPNSIGWNATYDARNRAVSMADTQEQAEGKDRQTAHTATWSARSTRRVNRPVGRSPWSFSSGQELDRILLDGDINRYHRHGVLHCLRNQDAVERIAVQWR